MLNWGPSKNIYDNWSKESYSLLDRGAVRYKKAFYTAVQRYKKNQQRMDSQGSSTYIVIFHGNTCDV